MLNDLHLSIDPQRQYASWAIGQQQLVDIAKALSHDARILVPTNPTAALTGPEAETLFGSDT